MKLLEVIFMQANYHTHTSLCGHAIGEIENYIDTAINNGVEILGFSDHIPCPFSTGYVSDIRMLNADTDVYFNLVSEAKKKYEGKIEIYFGYESEYYPDEFDIIIKNISHQPVDYLILGQHFLNNEYDGRYVGSIADAETLIHYVNQCIEGMKTGMFSYFAHPDLVNYPLEDDLYKKEITRLCETAAKYELPLELNLLGLKLGRAYPTDKFWKIASDIGNEVILGCDAHIPEDTGNPLVYDAGLEYIKKFNITPIETLNLIKPF